MTVAVVVDGITDDKGQYQPRTQEQLARLSDLIQAAVGYDVNRGDRVTVETMRFMPDGGLAEGVDSQSSQPLPAAAWSAIAAVAITLIAGVTLLLLRRRGQLTIDTAKDDQAAIAAAAGPMRLTSMGLKPAVPPTLGPTPQRLSIAQQAGQPLPIASDAENSTNADVLNSALGLAGADPAQQSLLASLFELIDQRPEEALSTLRSWVAGNA